MKTSNKTFLWLVSLAVIGLVVAFTCGPPLFSRLRGGEAAVSPPSSGTVHSSPAALSKETTSELPAPFPQRKDSPPLTNPESARAANSAQSPVISGQKTVAPSALQQAAPPAVATNAPVSDGARQQIQALEDEKAARTPVQQKIDSQLLHAAKEVRGEQIAGGKAEIKPDVEYIAGSRVLVDIKGEVTQAVLDAIVRTGGSVVNSHPNFRSIRAEIPVERVEEIAALTEVRSIRRAVQATTNVYTSEGDTAHAAAAARATYFSKGAGVKVGVLSDSVDYLANSYASGELSNVTVLPGQGGPLASGEGTAMLEIIRDLAPDAQLYFATAFNGAASYAQNILDLRAAGCDIIVDDVYYFSESPFQDDIVAQAVNSVTASGALYFSSAGNSGNKNDNTSGTWEGDFVDGGAATAPVAGKGGRLHSFGPATYNTCVSGGSSRRVDLFWSDPLDGSSNDYDVYVLNATGSTVLRSSTTTQNGTQDPYEFISTLNVNERIVIVKAAGASRFLHLETGRGRLATSTNGNIKGHSAADNAFSVAAVYGGTAAAFTGGAANPVEYFSSDGPRRIFYDAGGSPITPGNFLATGGTVRQKPDLAAADGVSTSVSTTFRPFYGTSAAAPHAAAIAALMKSYNPALTPTQLRAALLAGCLDIENAGVDRDSGSGLLMTPNAIQAAAALAPSPRIIADGLTLVSETATPFNTQIDPAEIVTVSFALRNTSNVATTNLVATLLTADGVTQPSAAQTYGVLAAGGGTASQQFTFRANGPTGGSNKAKLQLNDGATSLGVVEFTFNLGAGGAVTTLTYSGGAGVAIPSASASAGTPYPSNLTVWFSSGLITKLRATVSGVKHTYPDDVCVLLVGPAGQKVLLFANAGGGTDVSGADLTFDDAAASTLPDSSPITSGTYKPGGFGTAPTFASPAPLGPYASALSAFNSTSAVGVWRLYVYDDEAGDGGSISGWNLSITTRVPGPAETGTANLAVSLTAPAIGVVNANQTLVATVRNNGPASSTAATATYNLPAGYSYVSSSTSQGSSAHSSGVVTANLGSLATGASAVFTINVKPIDAGGVTHLVTVNASEIDADRTNNQASAFMTSGTVDLVPYQPIGWSAKLVVSTVSPVISGVYTDSLSLTTADTLYLSWSVINNGTQATNAGCRVAVYVDGTLYTTGTSSSTLNAGNYSYWSYASLGPLAPGSHSIRMVADSANAVSETNETNNEYTKNITVTGPNLPNLTPWRPSWTTDKIMISKSTDSYTYTDTFAKPTDTIYVDWYVLNHGPGAADGTRQYQLYVDGALRNTWTYSATLPPLYYTYALDYSIGSLSAGPHTIKLVADSASGITETVENDNEYTKTIVVSTGAIVTTGAASNLQQTSAILNGTVSPNGLATTALFQYGITPALGTQSASQNVGNGSSAVPVSLSVSGLQPGKFYYYRLVATNGLGTVYGAVRTFANPPPVYERIASFDLPPENPGLDTLTLGPDGYYWGTAKQGGQFDLGTIYKVKADGSDWQTVLSFSGNGSSNKGSYPIAGLVIDAAGYFWGTTNNGGVNNGGTVFKMDSGGVLTTVIEFTNREATNRGRFPYSPLVRDGAGNLWGTTSHGGELDYGTIFRINASTGFLTTVAEFTNIGGSKPGSYPRGRLINDGAGCFWGTTSQGGSNGLGTIYKVNMGTGVLSTLVQFTGSGGNNKGASPVAGLISDGMGSYWGSTQLGGTHNFGTIYKVDSGTGALTTLVEFTNNDANNKGATPRGELVIDGTGNLWGITFEGGDHDFGTVFKLNTSTGALTTLLEFTGDGASNKGSYPSAGLLNDGAGNFWGTTEFGAAGDKGTVFKVNASTGTLTTLVEFQNRCRIPYAGLVSDSAGLLWGTTSQGGSDNKGTVFKVNPMTGVQTTLVEFTGIGGNNKGTNPKGDLVSDGAGYFWGTTFLGGANDCGTVFKIDANTGVLTTIADFTGNGANNKGKTPISKLVSDGAGYLWGTTNNGGTDENGTVFKVNTTTGVLTTVILFSNNGASNKGRFPYASLFNDSTGNLWGTCAYGGAADVGTIFKISINTGALTTLIEFTGNGSTNKGSYPNAAPASDEAGNFWGTTRAGGASDFGTIYKVNASTGALTTLVQFTGTDGANKGSYPIAPVASDGSGFLWGTTEYGGTNNFGTVFKINASTGALSTVVEFIGDGTQGPVGSHPGFGALFKHADGNFHGTTQDGGPNGGGVIFRLRFGPTPVTEPATLVTSTGAKLRGTLNPNGTTTTTQFEWGTNPTLTTNTVASAGAVIAGSPPQAVNTTLSSLAPATTYYYRLRGTNSDNVIPQRGAILSFNTPATGVTLAALAPTLTSPASSTTTNSPVVVSFSLPETALAGSLTLTFTGTVTRVLTLAASQETDGEHSFSFDPANPTLSPEIASGAAIPDGSYTVTLSYQDVSGSLAATATSMAVVIATLPPTATTPVASVVDTTSATFNSKVNPNGAATMVSFEWGGTASLGSETTAYAVGSGSNDIAVSLPVADLTPSATYFFRVKAVNSAGTTISSTQSFTATIPTAVENWRDLYFGTAANSGNAADSFDYDKDGLSNLLEWACNLNPTTASTLPITTTRNGAVFEFTYTRSVAALNAGTAFTVEWSDDLPGSSWSATGITESILSDNGTVQQVKALVPMGSASRRFAHLKVTAPP